MDFRVARRFEAQGGEGKYLLKKGMESYLPRDILYRPKKGFAVPLAAWFRGPLRGRLQQALASDRLYATGVFDRRRLHRLFEQHDRGHRDWSTQLWAVLMFEAFLRGENA